MGKQQLRLCFFIRLTLDASNTHTQWRTITVILGHIYAIITLAACRDGRKKLIKITGMLIAQAYCAHKRRKNRFNKKTIALALHSPNKQYFPFFRLLFSKLAKDHETY